MRTLYVSSLMCLSAALCIALIMLTRADVPLVAHVRSVWTAPPTYPSDIDFRPSVHELRSSTVLACSRLAQLSGVSVSSSFTVFNRDANVSLSEDEFTTYREDQTIDLSEYIKRLEDGYEPPYQVQLVCGQEYPKTGVYILNDRWLQGNWLRRHCATLKPYSAYAQLFFRSRRGSVADEPFWRNVFTTIADNIPEVEREELSSDMNLAHAACMRVFDAVTYRLRKVDAVRIDVPLAPFDGTSTVEHWKPVLPNLLRLLRASGGSAVAFPEEAVRDAQTQIPNVQRILRIILMLSFLAYGAFLRARYVRWKDWHDEVSVACKECYAHFAIPPLWQFLRRPWPTQKMFADFLNQAAQLQALAQQRAREERRKQRREEERKGKESRIRNLRGRLDLHLQRHPKVAERFFQKYRSVDSLNDEQELSAWLRKGTVYAPEKQLCTPAAQGGKRPIKPGRKAAEIPSVNPDAGTRPRITTWEDIVKLLDLQSVAMPSRQYRRYTQAILLYLLRPTSRRGRISGPKYTQLSRLKTEVLKEKGCNNGKVFDEVCNWLVTQGTLNVGFKPKTEPVVQMSNGHNATLTDIGRQILDRVNLVTRIIHQELR